MEKMITLDTMGYVNDPSIILDRVFRNFFVANYSQTNVHYGRIHSLPWLIQRHGEQYFELSLAIKDALTEMLKGYFDSVDVDCDISPSVDGLEVKQIITVSINVYRGLQGWSAGRLLTMVKNRVSKIEVI